MKDLIKEIEPWETAVDGEELLNEVSSSIAKYLILQDGANEAMTLWIAHSYLYDTKDISPKLVFASPEMRCGKTTAVTLLAQLVNKPILASNVTAAAIFRMIERYHPTLIIDEADTFLKKSEDMRGIINSSHNRNSAFVIRVEGDKHRQTVCFSTWAPIAIAGIGSLAGTIEDRSVVIPMRRKRDDEKVEKLRHGTPELAILVRKLRRWADDNAALVAQCAPILPDELNDRAADNWDVLFAIAEIAGGEWPDRAEKAALLLSSDSEDSSTASSTKLLADLRVIFAGTEKLFSKTICDQLNKLEESDWHEKNYGKGVNQSWLAWMLAPYFPCPPPLSAEAVPSNQGGGKYLLK